MQAGAIAPASGFSVIERAPGRKAPILVQIEDPPQLFAIFMVYLELSGTQKLPESSKEKMSLYWN